RVERRRPEKPVNSNAALGIGVRTAEQVEDRLVADIVSGAVAFLGELGLARGILGAARKHDPHNRDGEAPADAHCALPDLPAAAAHAKGVSKTCPAAGQAPIAVPT